MATNVADAAGTHVFSVSELNRSVRDVLETAFGPVWIAGELSNIARPASGHMYFTLKDADAQVRCAMFRGRNRLLEFAPEAGMSVRARARVGLYEARGDYQLVVEQLEPWGEGALARAFEALKRRLDAEGLFAVERKRALPSMPRRIGVVTSSTGAAVRDVLRVLARRFPAIPVMIYPVAVQGEQAAAGIAAMLERAGQRAECDVLLLVRGGGSLEDLWAFNEEAVVRAIGACPLPVVSGIGHEVDVTIADFAADRRAPTPSAAAEVVAPDGTEIARGLAHLERRLWSAARAKLAHPQQQRAALARRLHRQHPARRLQQLEQRADELVTRLQRAAQRELKRHHQRYNALERRLLRATPGVRVERLQERLGRAQHRLAGAMRADLQRRRERVAGAARALEAVSPLAVLGRGYALVRRGDDGRAVTDARQAQGGDALDIHLARGQLEATVDRAHAPDGEDSQ